MNLARITLASATIALTLTACSSEESSPDGGVSPADATTLADMGVAMLPEAGRPDAQPRPDAGSMDAAMECIDDGTMTVDGTEVMVGPAGMHPVSRLGAQAVLTCRGRRPTLSIGAPVRAQGCLEFVGGRASLGDLDRLDVAVFYAVDPDTNTPTDPTLDGRTGLDRTPTARIRPDVVLTNEPALCPNGIRMVMGREAEGPDTIRTDLEYVIRTRSSTVGAAGEPLWVDQYHWGITIRSDQIDGASADRCSPTTCSGRIDLVLARRSALRAIAGQTGAMIAGLADLDDHVGSGHLMVQALDCTGLTMSNVSAGFVPAATARSYLTAGYGYSNMATTTSTTGILLGLGFTGTSSVAPRRVTVGAALSLDGMCAEPYAGRAVPVYPDAISLVRLGRENTIVP